MRKHVIASKLMEEIDTFVKFDIDDHEDGHFMVGLEVTEDKELTTSTEFLLNTDDLKALSELINFMISDAS